jgi:ABC-2 type transport system permease protein
MTRVVDGVDLALSECKRFIPHGLRPGVRRPVTTLKVVIVVTLVNGKHHARGIDHRAALAGAPHNPVVVARTADCERRHGVEQASRKHEVVDSGRATHLALGECLHTKSLAYVLGLEQQSLAYVDVRRPAHHQERRCERLHLPDGGQKVVQQNDIGVEKAAQGVSRDPVDAGECIVEPGRSMIAPSDRRDVVCPGFPRGLGDTRVVAQEDDLYVGAEPGPARNGVPLNHADMPFECLRDCEESQHLGSVARYCCRSSGDTAEAPRYSCAMVAQVTRISRWDKAYYLRVLRVIARAEFKVKYADSVLGYAWTILKPLTWFAVLYVVFGRFFKLQGGFHYYAVYLLVGIVLWTFFVDSTMLALYAYVTRGDVLRKLAFPRLVLSVASVTTTSLTLVANATVVVIFAAVSQLQPHWQWLLIPVPVVEIIVFTVGVCVILAVVHVQLKDTRQIWELLVQLLFFASPIMYPVGYLPMWAQKVAFVDPFVQALQDVRALLIPENKTITAADVYGSAWGYLIPSTFLVALLLFAARYYRREAPYLAERT